MTRTQASRLIWQTKRNIGHLLTDIRMSVNSPDQTTIQSEARGLLGANQSQLQELYKKFPEFAPVRVRQLKLNL